MNEIILVYLPVFMLLVIWHYIFIEGWCEIEEKTWPYNQEESIYALLVGWPLLVVEWVFFWNFVADFFYVCKTTP